MAKLPPILTSLRREAARYATMRSAGEAADRYLEWLQAGPGLQRHLSWLIDYSDAPGNCGWIVLLRSGLAMQEGYLREV